MCSIAPRGRQRFIARLISHARTPLYRNAYALILSSATTSGLGVVYWVIAARAYTAEVVGVNSAAISAMMFLAGVAQLNLMSALVRFVPNAGRKTKRFAISTYLIGVSVAAVASLVFVIGLERWSPALQSFGANPLFAIWFVVATMAWVVFVLQDSLLTGLRQAIWVPIENAAFAIMKLVLLVVFASGIPQFGIFASWTGALAISLLPTNLLIFLRLIPQHVRETQDHAVPLQVGQIARYVSGDNIGSLSWLACTTLLPVIIIQEAGATATAYFYLAWTIVYSLYNASSDMGASLTVEGARDQAKLAAFSFRAFVQMAYLILPAVAIILIGAPYILLIFGEAYATEGAALFRLLALSAIPNIVTAIFVSVSRVQRHISAIVVMLVTLAALVLSLSIVLLKIYGITGVGLAWLISQTFIAGIILATKFRKLWWQSPLTPPLVRGVGGIIADSRFLPLLRMPRDFFQRRRLMSQAAQVIPKILPAIPASLDLPSPTTWRARDVLRTVTDSTVISLGPEKQSPVAMLKLSRTENGKTSLHRQCSAIANLRTDSRLGDWRVLLPEVLAQGEIDNYSYVVEKIIRGIDARQVVSNPDSCARMQELAMKSISELHAHTARRATMDEPMLARWIDEPLMLVRPVIASLQNASRYEGALERLENELRGALTGRAVSVSWIHGDFVPGNILLTPDGSALAGILDWDQARPDDLPFLDPVWLLLSTRLLAERRELGEVMRDFLNRAQWTTREQNLLDSAELPGEAISARASVLLVWLRHVAANLSKSTRYAEHWFWITKNIETVLQSI